ncbi:MAG: DUF3179 domain-containing protein [Acidobacteria bacterium]|nr:DUF3179 domain-containing protein [Acidobacteriota bacterium]
MKRAGVAAFVIAAVVHAQAPPALTTVLQAGSPDGKIAAASFRDLAAVWRDGYTAMFIDMARLMRAPRGRLDESRASFPAPDDVSATLDDPTGAPSSGRIGAIDDQPRERGAPARRRLLAFLEQRTGQRFGDNLNQWRQWMWALPYAPHPDYAAFKGLIYGQIDPRMREFFPAGVRSSIRLDEIDWGGVVVNGIPPLRYPRVVPAAAAGYLHDTHVVFGIDVNGEARAYPKRILAWHEMAVDRVGGLDLTIVYCTLCGTVIPFESRAGDRTFRFGTSGLLYQSNKLMFDEYTNSLWSTFEGEPVVGRLVGSGVKLRTRAVVTTTWKEWRSDHPNTTVLSLDTGYQRDYAEGAAYRDYFATDRLMFQVSRTDARLRNKTEVLVMQVSGGQTPGRTPVAIDAAFLRKHRVYSFEVGEERFVVVTSERGANRVYRVSLRFPEQRAGSSIVDTDGRRWRVTESDLVLESAPETRLARVSAQRAFWFGWYAQFPDTILIK